MLLHSKLSQSQGRDGISPTDNPTPLLIFMTSGPGSGRGSAALREMTNAGRQMIYASIFLKGNLCYNKHHQCFGSERGSPIALLLSSPLKLSSLALLFSSPLQLSSLALLSRSSLQLSSLALLSSSPLQRFSQDLLSSSPLQLSLALLFSSLKLS